MQILQTLDERELAQENCTVLAIVSRKQLPLHPSWVQVLKCKSPCSKGSSQPLLKGLQCWLISQQFHQEASTMHHRKKGINFREWVWLISTLVSNWISNWFLNWTSYCFLYWYFDFFLLIFNGSKSIYFNWCDFQYFQFKLIEKNLVSIRPFSNWTGSISDAQGRL